jgi:hypothetical protein
LRCVGYDGFQAGDIKLERRNLRAEVISNMLEGRPRNLHFFNVRPPYFQHLEVQVDGHPHRHQEQCRQRERQDQLEERDTLMMLTSWISMKCSHA